MHPLLRCILLLTPWLRAGAQIPAGRFTFDRGALASAMQPAIRVDVNPAFEYIGSQRWLLYERSQAEQHLFVERDSLGVARLLWLQFEEYLPGVEGRYDYPGSERITAFGRQLRVDRELWMQPTRPHSDASDAAHAMRLLGERGVALPPGMVFERLVFVPDPDERRELMVLYFERGSAIDGSMPAATRRDSLAALEMRALQSFTIRDTTATPYPARPRVPALAAYASSRTCVAIPRTDSRSFAP